MDKLKNEVLETALRDVPFDGWTQAVLDAAARKRGHGGAHALFPRGLPEALGWFSHWADMKMLEKMKGADLESMRVRDRVSFGVRARLEILTPHRQAVSAALGRLAPPPRNIALPKIVWRTADAVWRAAGDTSTDYNYYTKRILLAGVITSTTLFWLGDDSPGFAKTWDFLERKIEVVLKLGRAAGKLGSLGKRRAA